MKAFLLIISLLLSQISCTTLKNKLSSLENDRPLSTAFLDIIHELFNRHGIQFEIVIYGESSPHINDVIDGLRSGGFFAKISKFVKYFVYNPAIIFFSSMQQLIEFIEKNKMVKSEYPIVI